jgi:cell wall-associated NlpC family hydrolase
MFSRQVFPALFLLSILTLACENNTKTIEMFNERAGQIQVNHAPDLSLNIFQAKLILENGQWVLQGETTLPDAKEKAIAFLDSLLGEQNYKDEFIELPHLLLGDSTFALVKVSVANLREEPRHSAQLVDQNIMGRTLRLLKNEKGWYLVQTEYGYIGWMRRESFYRIDREGIKSWKEVDKVKVTQLFPMIYSKPDEQSEPVTDIVLNAILRLEGQRGEWTKISTPDGRIGFIKSQFVSKDNEQNVSREKLRNTIINTARSMMGFPYLWGGNSSKGNDCSGFTQTVFKANGIDLLRDARQQVLEGEEIIPDETFSNILPGDLLFFGSGERITHVGISLGGAEFVHQSGDVHINSLNPQAENFSAYRRKSLKKIKRFL